MKTNDTNTNNRTRIEAGEITSVSNNQLKVNEGLGDTIPNLYTVKEGPFKGNMGQVFRVHHNGWNIDLAMKQSILEGEELRKQFIDECDTWVNLGLHPHIVSCYYVRNIKGILSIFSEWMDGGNLKDFIGEGKGALYEGTSEEVLERILDIGVQAIRGLDYAHENKVIHRDVKPANILLLKDSSVKVGDFGISKTKEMQYTPTYCSPEQVKQGSRLTPKTDVWSWAATVLEMFIGRKPGEWTDGNKLGDEWEKYAENLQIQIPQQVESILADCFKKDESLRPDFKKIENRLLAAYEEIIGKTYPRPRTEAAGDSADSLNNKALSHLDMGEADEAYALLCKAIEREPQHLESMYNLSLIRWRKGEIDDLETVSRVDQNSSPRKNYFLACIQMERGDILQVEANCNIVKEKGLNNEFDQEISRLLLLCGEKREWDITGQCISGKSKRGGVFPACISDNKQIALIVSNRSTVNIVDLKTHEICGKLCEEPNINAVCFDDEGEEAFIATSNTIKIWDTTSNKQIETLNGHTGTIDFLTYIAPYLVSASKDDKTIRLWDLFRNDSEIIEGYNGNALQCADTGTYDFDLYASIYNDINIVRIASLSDEDMETRLVENPQWNSVLAVSPDGTRVLSADKCYIKMWDLYGKRCLYTFVGHTSDVIDIRFSQEGYFFLSQSFEESKMWSVPDFDYTAELVLCRITPFKKINDFENKAHTVTHTIKKLIEEKKIKEALALVNDFEASPQVVPHKDFLETKTILGKYCKRKEIKTFILRNKIELDVRGGSDLWVEKVTILSKDFNKVLTTNSNNEVILIDMKTGDTIKTFSGHTTEINTICLNDEESMALSGDIKGDVFLWDVVRGTSVLSLQLKYQVDHVCFDPEYKTKAYICYGTSAIILWDFSTNTIKWELNPNRKEYHPIEYMWFAPDKKKCLTTDTQKSYVFNMPSHEKIYEIDKFTEPRSVQFSPDGTKLLAGNRINDIGTTYLYEISEKTCTHLFSANTSGTLAVCFSPDGRKAYYSDNDAICCRDVSDMIEAGFYFYGDEILLEEHIGIIESLDISPDGKWLISADNYGEIKIWDVSACKCIKTFTTVDYLDKKSFAKFDSSGSKMAFLDTGKNILQQYLVDYEYEFPGWANWDEGARPYFEIFLKLYPDWTENHFENLIEELQNRGYGWLRPEGVKAKLVEISPKKKKLFGFFRKR